MSKLAQRSLPVVIGASYNIEKPTGPDDNPNERLIREAKKKAVEYYGNNGRTVSSKIYRIILKPGTIPGVPVEVDLNKNLIPVYGVVPTFMLEVMRLTRLTDRIAAVGSDDVGLYVEAYKDFRRMGGHGLDDRVTWAFEGTNLSLFNTVARGISALNLKEREQFLFTTGDVPFADFREQLYDDDIEKGGMVIDFCGKKSIWGNEPELFPRNWYQIILQGMQTTYVKEPNAFVFVNDPRILDMIGLFYREKRTKGVTQGEEFMDEITTHIQQFFPQGRDPKEIIRFIECSLRTGIIYLAQKRPENSKIPGLYLSGQISTLGNRLLGYPMVFKAEHSDPMMLRDIDGFHDVGYYLMLMQEAASKYGSMENAIKNLLPFGDEVIAFNEYLLSRGIPDRVPLIKYFPQIMNYYCDRLGIGRFYEGDRPVWQVLPNEDIQGSIAFLENRTAQSR
ncbi:MAG: hypothetical protein ABIJ34_03680 [archaeon]